MGPGRGEMGGSAFLRVPNAWPDVYLSCPGTWPGRTPRSAIVGFLPLWENQLCVQHPQDWAGLCLTIVSGPLLCLWFLQLRALFWVQIPLFNFSSFSPCTLSLPPLLPSISSHLLHPPFPLLLLPSSSSGPVGDLKGTVRCRGLSH